MIDNEILRLEMTKPGNPMSFDLPKHTFAYAIPYKNIKRFLELTSNLEENREQKIRITVDHVGPIGLTFKLEADFMTCIWLANDVADEFRGSVSLIPF